MDKLAHTPAAPFPSLSADDRAQLDAAKAQLREAVQVLKTDLADLRCSPQAAAGLALLPLRLVFGLPLVVGVIWGLWQAFT